MPLDIKQIPIDELRDLIFQLEQAGLVVRSKRPRLNHYDYEKWDWLKRNNDLAREHGVSTTTVSNWRKKLGKSFPYKYQHPEWDWSKADAEISRENKVPPSVVQKYRLRLGIPFAAKSERAIPPNRAFINPRYDVDWVNINWKRADITIAREIGCTRELVRQKRATLGIQKFHRCMEKYEEFLKLADGRKEMSYSDLNGHSISKLTFSRYCTQSGIKRISSFIRTSTPWNLMNWNLPNKFLAEIWRLPAARKIAIYRCNHHLHPAVFHPRRKIQPDEYHQQISEEKKKADLFFNPNSMMPQAKLQHESNPLTPLTSSL